MKISHYVKEARDVTIKTHLLTQQIKQKACTKTRNNETKPPKQAKL